MGCHLSLPLTLVVVVTIITSVLSLNKMMALIMTFPYMFITCFAQSVRLDVSADPLWGTEGFWRVPGPGWKPPKLFFFF